MERVLQTVRQIATTDLPVLIEGDTGTGKELIACAVYRHSARVKGPFVVLNCAAIPATLIGSELFGFVQGAFTGANRDRIGFVGTAHRGTLFLDEIGDLPLDQQPHLLRVLTVG
jgi:two-component system nitrogen regulation response regulator GlnG